MQKSSNNLKKLLVKYHSVMGDNSLTDKMREHRLRIIKSKISKHSMYELKGVANGLSESENHSMIFRLWCELINLTGDV